MLISSVPTYGFWPLRSTPAPAPPAAAPAADAAPSPTTDAAWLAITMLAAGSTDQTARGIADIAVAAAAPDHLGAAAASPNALAAIAVKMLEASPSMTQRAGMSEAALKLMLADPKAAEGARVGLEASGALSDNSRKVAVRMRALQSIQVSTPAEVADLGLGIMRACEGSNAETAATAPALLGALERAGARTLPAASRQMLGANVSNNGSKTVLMRHTFEAVKAGRPEDAAHVAGTVKAIVDEVATSSNAEAVAMGLGAVGALRGAASPAEQALLDFSQSVSQPAISTSSLTQRSLLATGLGALSGGWSDGLSARAALVSRMDGCSTENSVKAALLEKGLAWVAGLASNAETGHAVSVLTKAVASCPSNLAKATMLKAALDALPAADGQDWPLVTMGRKMTDCQVDASAALPLVETLLREIAAQASSTEARSNARDTLARMASQTSTSKRLQMGRDALDAMSKLVQAKTQVTKMAEALNNAPAGRIEQTETEIVIGGVRVARNAGSAPA